MTWVRGCACLRLCCLSWGTGNWALLWDISIIRIMILSLHTICVGYLCPSHPFGVIIHVSCLHPQGLHISVNFGISVMFGQGKDLQCLVNLRHIENIVKFRKACLIKIRHNGVTHEAWLHIGHKLRRPEWQSNPVKTLKLCTTFCLMKVCCTTSSAQLNWKSHWQLHIAGTVKPCASILDSTRGHDKMSISDEHSMRTGSARNWARWWCWRWCVCVGGRGH